MPNCCEKKINKNCTSLALCSVDQRGPFSSGTSQGIKRTWWAMLISEKHCCLIIIIFTFMAFQSFCSWLLTFLSYVLISQALSQSEQVRPRSALFTTPRGCSALSFDAVQRVFRVESEQGTAIFFSAGSQIT